MISEGSHPTLVNCTFENNCAFKNGGGIYNFLSNPTLTGCVFRNNMVIGPYSGSTRGPQSGGGGGMYNKNSSPVLTNCLFSENSAGYGGGIYNVADSNVTLFDCTFNGNLVSVRGGGLSNRDDCNLTMTNCLIVSNWAKGYGGGIFCNGEITLLNCTIVGNRTSSYDGGGIYFQVGRIDNSIIYGNITAVTKGSEIAQDPHGQAGCLPELINITHSIIGSDPNAFDIPRCYSGEWRHADPLFVDPGYWDANGTPDDPNDDFWIDGDYHLKSQAGRWDPVSESWVFDDVTSPCIDAGDPNSPVAFEPFPNGGIINMGTYGSTAEASKSPSGIHAKYGGGTGEPNNPYLIYTAEHMNTIGTEPNDWDKHFKLMADIDLDPNLPDGKIYDEAIIRYFKGVFDGNGHTISNFSYTSSDGYSIGLFRKISGQNTQIKDLGLIAPDIYVESGSHIGSLVGMVSSGTISNCYAEGGNVSGEELVGGLVGLNHGNLNDCYSTCNVYGDDEVGGLVGLNSSTTITNCSAGGEVFGRNCVAGLAGSNSGTIKNSSALGSITVEKHSIVTRDNRSFGGLIGRNSGPLIGCTAGGDVSGDVFVGGLVGNSSASIINCYATGSVLGTDYVGGLVGSIGATIENCYAIGGVSGTTYVGGLVGYKDVEAKVMASFWDIQTSDWATSDGGTSKSTVEMYTASTFLNAGWDFVDETANGTEDIWWILEGQDYPRLWWEMINEK
jgi:predicted outer membrane repeat protein